MALTLRKEISVDGGHTWHHVSSPPGPNVLKGMNPKFRFTIRNTGWHVITNVHVSDSVIGSVANVPRLYPHTADIFERTVAWASGEHHNTATASGTEHGRGVSDTDHSYYFGLDASISIQKEVSPDGGHTWFDAPTPPGPVVSQGTDPMFRFTVTNTGNVTLTNVTVVDSVFHTIDSNRTLAPGAHHRLIRTGMWAQGEHHNTVTATGTGHEHHVVDTDVAHYLGEVSEPEITLQKLVSVDQGATFVPAGSSPGPMLLQGINPIYRYVIVNSGNTVLNNVTLNDSDFGPIPLPSSQLAIGQSMTVEEVGSWRQGIHENVAHAHAYFNGQPLNSDSEAFFFGQVSAAPIFPNLGAPAPQRDILNRLLETIALGELSLSALMNAEAQKVQAAVLAGVLGPVDAEDAVAVNNSVEEVMRRVADKDTSLYRKLERVFRLKETGA